MLSFNEVKSLFGDQVVYSSPGSDFRIIASREGISFQGGSPTITDSEELAIFARAVTEAWKAHKKFVPKIAHPTQGT